MFTSLYRLLSVVVVLSLILVMAVATPTTAAPIELGTGQATASAPQPGWIVLQPGQVHWYKFTYHFDRNADKDAEVPPALVDVKMEMPRAVEFSVETARNMALPKEDEDGNLRQPVGVGSMQYFKIHGHDTTVKVHEAEKLAANEHKMFPMEGELFWTTASKATETFYVIVKNTHDHPCAYQISITGKTVSF